MGIKIMLIIFNAMIFRHFIATCGGGFCFHDVEMLRFPVSTDRHENPRSLTDHSTLLLRKMRQWSDL